MTTPRTMAAATGELLRSRPATKMPGYVALEVVRVGKANELWHVVMPGAVDALVRDWSLAHGIHCQYFVQETTPCPMCGSTEGDEVADDGLNRCKGCGCH